MQSLLSPKVNVGNAPPQSIASTGAIDDCRLYQSWAPHGFFYPIDRNPAYSAAFPLHDWLLLSLEEEVMGEGGGGLCTRDSIDLAYRLYSPDGRSNMPGYRRLGLRRYYKGCQRRNQTNQQNPTTSPTAPALHTKSG